MCEPRHNFGAQLSNTLNRWKILRQDHKFRSKEEWSEVTGSKPAGNILLLDSYGNWNYWRSSTKVLVFVSLSFKSKKLQKRTWKKIQVKKEGRRLNCHLLSSLQPESPQLSVLTWLSVFIVDRQVERKYFCHMSMSQKYLSQQLVNEKDSFCSQVLAEWWGMLVKIIDYFIK